MSDTPRTDAFDLFGNPPFSVEYERLFNFARQLERELNQVTKERNYFDKLCFADDTDSTFAACDCLTKSPEIKYHKKGCKYRLVVERDEAKEQAKNWFAQYNAMKCAGDTDLESELEKTKKEVNELNLILRKAGWGQGEIDSAAAMLDEAEQDSIRLDWLESNAGVIATSLYFVDGKYLYRQAIDAAMKGEVK